VRLAAIEDSISATGDRLTGGRSRTASPEKWAASPTRAVLDFQSAYERRVGWTDVYVDAVYSDLRDGVRDKPDTLISALETRYGRRIAEIRQDILAVPRTSQVFFRGESGSS
jgi:hypothetical protein